MVYDRFRGHWELPGGLLEPGESPRQAAVRELAEESGQMPDAPLCFVGYAGFLLSPGGAPNTVPCSPAAPCGAALSRPIARSRRCAGGI
ncbi:NUDIX hydrolase [Streptomyces sp. A012304]|uniref:NUDIX hydrolase n=1 Tax=Streptomyces sp. A012304 TaxID=375446 RepID=UPI0035D467D2